jgi:hypothetical protein
MLLEWGMELMWCEVKWLILIKQVKVCVSRIRDCKYGVIILATDSAEEVKEWFEKEDVF